MDRTLRLRQEMTPYGRVEGIRNRMEADDDDERAEGPGPRLRLVGTVDGK
jgi:hypothetical protein